jgi:hypothetical protein
MRANSFFGPARGQPSYAVSNPARLRKQEYEATRVRMMLLSDAAGRTHRFRKLAGINPTDVIDGICHRRRRRAFRGAANHLMAVQ